MPLAKEFFLLHSTVLLDNVNIIASSFSKPRLSWNVSYTPLPHVCNSAGHGPAYDHCPVGPAQAGPPLGTEEFLVFWVMLSILEISSKVRTQDHCKISREQVLCLNFMIFHGPHEGGLAAGPRAVTRAYNAEKRPGSSHKFSSWERWKTSHSLNKFPPGT